VIGILQLLLLRSSRRQKSEGAWRCFSLLAVRAFCILLVATIYSGAISQDPLFVDGHCCVYEALFQS
jgi:hypothetical protein